MKRKLVLLLFVAVFLVGCSSYQREMVPPKVDLGSSRRIAVLFFDNLTDDYALVYEVEQQLVEQLGVFTRSLTRGKRIGPWQGLACVPQKLPAQNRLGVWENC